MKPETKAAEPEGEVGGAEERLTLHLLQKEVEEKRAQLERANDELAQEVAGRNRRERELRRTNRAYRMLALCSQAMIRAADEQDLLTEICNIVVETGGYRLAWVGFSEHDRRKSVRPVAQAGYEAGYLDTLHLTWADTERGRGPTGTAIRTSQPVSARDILADLQFAPWRAEAMKRGYASSLALPLLAEGQTLGALNIYAAEPDAFDVDEVELLVELAGDLAYGITALRTRAERQRTEKALRQEKEFVENLIETAQAIIVVLDHKGRIVRINRYLEELSGHTVEEVRGRDWFCTFLPERDRDRIRNLFLTAVGGVQTRGSANPIVTRDGREREIEWHDSILTDAEGQTIGLLAVGQDITDRLRAEQALERRAEELARANRMVSALNQVSGRLQATLNPDAMLETLGAELQALGLTCVVALLEPGAETLLIHYHSILPEMLALSDEIVGGALNEVRIPFEAWPVEEILEQGRGLYDRQPLQAVSALLPSVSETLLKRAMREVGLSGDSPMAYLPLAAEDQVLGVLVVWGEALKEADVPALAVFANQLGSAFQWARQVSQVAELEFLRELTRLRSELITDISHEFRTPLGLVKLSAATLLRENAKLGTDVQEEFLRTIVDEADRMNLIVGDLLDLSQIEGGRFRLDKKSWDLRLLVGGVCASMEVQFPEHQLVQVLPSERLTATVDASRFEQVLRNLLENAAKYSPEGSVITTRGSRQGGQILIQVSDQGIGIPEESLHRVFERFYRVHSQTTTKAKGVGLGLSICRGIVEIHGGQIWAESSPGAGTTMSFTLPIDPAW